MAGMTRGAWLATMVLGPLAGAGAALAGRKKSQKPRWQNIPPRELIRRRHFPNVELITHDGKKVRFYHDLVKDRKVIFNFMYARCQGICVPVTANLVRVQRLLGERVGRDIFMYSITLKPKEDNATVLKKYAERHGVGPGWLFLTGKGSDVERVRRGLGFVSKDPVEDADKSNHIGMLRYGDEPGMRWAACPGQASPKHIVKSILWDLESPAEKGS